jgi:hypothetical protein
MNANTPVSGRGHDRDWFVWSSRIYVARWRARGSLRDISVLEPDIEDVVAGLYRAP